MQPQQKNEGCNHKAASALGSLLPTKAWGEFRVWYRDHGRHSLPWRREASPWGIFVAETLLHRTRAEVVEKLYPQVLGEFPKPEIVALNEERFLEATFSAGLAWRGRVFVYACKRLVSQHGGHVPECRDALISLPGVGHYIASAVRCFGFGKREVIVDSNTIRLAARISGENLDSSQHRTQRVRAIVARLSEDSVPLRPDDNYALLDLATSLCRTRNPVCNQCPVRLWCATGRHALTSVDCTDGRG